MVILYYFDRLLAFEKDLMYNDAIVLVFKAVKELFQGYFPE